MYHLTTLERAVLRVLRDGRPRTSSEITQLSDEPGYAVRATLKELKRWRLVAQEWSIRDRPAGAWEITDRGLTRLRGDEQLRLIG